MSTNIDPQRSIAAWLESEAPDRAPARLIDASREHVRTTRQRPAWWPARRTSDMNAYAKLAIAAAAVVVVAIVGYNLLPSRGGVGGSAQPSASPSPTPSPVPIRSGSLDAGTYTAPIPDAGVDVTLTLPSGWKWDGAPILTKTSVDAPDGYAIAFWGGEVQVYTDPCQWHAAEPNPPTGPTARDLVDALAAQPQRNAKAPVERQGRGSGESQVSYPGWSIDLTVPTDAELVGGPCYSGEFRSWGPEENARYHQGPGQRDTVWAIDVEGSNRLIVEKASWPGTSAEAMAEMAAIIDSMRFSKSS
jgi:hypothetical protein